MTSPTPGGVGNWRERHKELFYRDFNRVEEFHNIDVKYEENVEFIDFLLFKRPVRHTEYESRGPIKHSHRTHGGTMDPHELPCKNR